LNKNIEKPDPNLLTPKTVKIAAKINVATPPVEESTSAFVRETIPFLVTEPSKVASGVTTDRKPKVVSVDVEVEEDPKNAFPAYDIKESKQGSLDVLQLNLESSFITPDFRLTTVHLVIGLLRLRGVRLELRERWHC
jgi:hypothetical protein